MESGEDESIGDTVYPSPWDLLVIKVALEARNVLPGSATMIYDFVYVVEQVCTVGSTQ